MSNYGPTTHRQSEASRWRMPHRHGLKPQQKWPTSKKNIPTTVKEKARTSNRTSQTMEEWPVWKKRTCLCADGWDISTESDISTAAFILTNRANLWADYAVALWHIHNCYWQLESLLFLNPPCPFDCAEAELTDARRGRRLTFNCWLLNLYLWEMDV